MKPDPIRAIAWWLTIVFCLGFWAAMFKFGTWLVEVAL